MGIAWAQKFVFDFIFNFFFFTGGGEEFEGSENITFEMPSVHWLNRERRGFIVYLLT